jgi:hypothetical protein
VSLVPDSPPEPEGIAGRRVAEDLERLRGHGIAGAGGLNELDNIARRCRTHSETTGDARYVTIAEAIETIVTWWREHDELGGVPIQAVERVNHVLANRLPPAMLAETAREGVAEARKLREEVQGTLSQPSDWEREGWAWPIAPDDS